MHPREFGKIRMHHDAVSFTDKKNQKSGFGIDFYRHTESAYKKIPKIKDITMLANLTVGGYAWTRVGFQFDISTTEGRAAKADLFMKAFKVWERAGRMYTKATGKPVPDFPMTPANFTTHNLAALKAPWDTGDDRFGKKFLLNKLWQGIKSMDENSIDWKVGQLYYGLRDSKK
jgi:hypothetical protein